MTIDEILVGIPDKKDLRKTTSLKFKRDIFNFFNTDEFKEKSAVEWGSFLGQTTYVLSFLFKKVTGFNLNDVSLAKETNKDRGNVEFHALNIYTNPCPIDFGDIFLVDASHDYMSVMSDINRSLKFGSIDKKYFIFDDYGHIPGVRNAVDTFIKNDILEIIKPIGYNIDEMKQIIGGHSNTDEGLICREK